MSRNAAVMREDTADLRAGEVFYSLEDIGEGLLFVWRRGESFIVEYEDQSKIDWLPLEASEVASGTLGTWARVTRENGQAGWVLLEYGHFECLGSLAGDLYCRD